MRNRTRRAVLAALALVTFAGPFAKAEITNPFDIDDTTHFSEDLVFPGYDSANGPLRAVALCVRWLHVRTITCENLDAQPADITTDFGTAMVDLSLGSTSMLNLSFAPFQQVNALPAFDGTFDYSGPSSCSHRERNIGNQIIFFDDPTLLSQFIDQPTVTINATGIDIFSMTGPGNAASESTTTFRLQGELIYYDA